MVVEVVREPDMEHADLWVLPRVSNRIGDYQTARLGTRIAEVRVERDAFVQSSPPVHFRQQLGNAPLDVELSGYPLESRDAEGLVRPAMPRCVVRQAALHDLGPHALR